MERLKPYLEIARAEFLVFGPIVASVPISLSVVTGDFDAMNALLGTVMFVAAHIAVNSINVASDYRRGIDEDTEETPFSGGVDTLTSGRASYATARNMGIAFVAVSVVPMIWFVRVYGAVPLAVLLLIGLVLVVGYTDIFARVGLGEVSCGLGLGVIPTLVIFYVQSGRFTGDVILVSVPMFLVCFNLLLLNEFPDVEADRANGRRNVPVLAGRRKAGILYISVAAATVVSVLCLYALGLPVTVLAALLPVALLYRPVREILSEGGEVTEGGLLMHTVWTLSTPALLSAGIAVQVFV